MWTQEIINVVVENKNRGTFIEKTAWSHDGMNVIVQFAGAFNWGALDLTPAQYEAIEETSYDPDTYDSVYNSGSRYEIKDFQASLFLDGQNSLDVEFCGPADSSGQSTPPDDETLAAMSNNNWFAETYGVPKGDVTGLYAALSANGWSLLGRMYAIEGDIEVLRKSEYDYLWIPEDELNAASAAAEEELYSERVRFLNNRDEG
tara:strand:+ start:737 stop:1345 length:609 start_codon:yes stop_codon:yes gene_type:complete